MIWANLLHLSYNFWGDREDSGWKTHHAMCQPFLRFDEGLWRDLTLRMSQAGFNMVVIDLGDGVQYQSHPEIAVKEAWSPGKLRDELARLRDLGLEPIPKLNFSACHDAWLGEYSRMLSTSIYYRVCQDLIDEVVSLFDGPRYFHLGMDEETAGEQIFMSMAVVRQHELWWHDLKFYIEQVETRGSKAWIWADSCWHQPENFAREMPKSVIQSNWYYGDRFDFSQGEDPKEEKWARFYKSKVRCAGFDFLDSLGMNQIPTGSNVYNGVNFEALVPFCLEHVPAERLQGFLMTPWHPTLEESRTHHLAAIDQVARAKRAAKF